MPATSVADALIAGMARSYKILHAAAFNPVVGGHGLLCPRGIGYRSLSSHDALRSPRGQEALQDCKKIPLYRAARSNQAFTPACSPTAA